MTNPTPAERVAQLRLDEKSAARRRNLAIGATVTAVLVLLIAVGLVLQNKRDTTGDTASEPAGATSDYGVLVGDEDAPTTIVVYEDFQCPICQAFEDATAKQLAAAVEDGTVNVEYRMVSFLDRASKNAYSSRAANAAAAVLDTAGPEAFQAFHAALFADQPAEGTAGPSNADLIDQAVEAGAAYSEVAPLIENGAYDDWVIAATDAMSRAGVNGTPTALIDGKVAGSNPAESIEAVLAALT